MQPTEHNPASEPAARPRGYSPLERALLLFGSLGPCGWMPASGTVTVALLGMPSVWLAWRMGLSLPGYVLITILFTGLAVWVHGVGDKLLGEKDSRKLVLDELAGYWVAMIAVPATWPYIVLGFFIERALDILKIWPANWIERRLPGGWGVVGDDIVAGLYTLGILHLVRFVAP